MRAEPGWERVRDVLSGARISSVNWCETLQKIEPSENQRDELRELLLSQGLIIVPFDVQQAEVAADLLAHTKAFGLSLGDRACLALARVLGGEVFTTDRAWANVNVGVPIQLIR